MAELIQVRVKDFRAFPEATFEMPAHGLVLVTGQNNAGKSALLSALDVIAGYETPQAVRHANAKGSAHVWARFRLTDQERAELLGDSPKTAALLDRGAAQWLEWDFTELGSGMQAGKLSMVWPDKDELLIGQVTMTSTNQWRLSAQKEVPLANWSQESLSMAMEGGGKLKQFLENATNAPALRSASDSLLTWRQSYFHFKPLRQVPNRIATLSSTPDLAGDGSNLAEVLHYLQSNKPRLWQAISRLIEEIVPGVGTLMLPSEQNQFSIAFLDSHVDEFHHNLKDLGTGVEQLLMTLVVGLTANARTVVLEEPETGLHPAAQRALLSLLQEWSSADRVFAASTHSPVLLDWSSSTVLAVTRDASSSSVTPVVHERASILRDLGVRPSDILSADRILVLEGATDEQIVNVWFPKLIRDPRLVVIDGGGGDSARHVELLSSWLEKADELGSRKILYVRDRDELPADFMAKLDASRSVFVLPCRELENLLLDFDAVATVLTEATGSELPALDLETQARMFADQLKGTIVLKRVSWELGIHRHVDNRLRGELAARAADIEALTDVVIGRLPKPDDLREQISTAWERHVAHIDATWQHEWPMLVPGADLLDLLWKHYLGRGYKKASDGLLIAREMKQPPAVLGGMLATFMVP